jgi:D-glycero-beta-D-manno-heptose 1-phosphate adenylyltransferase
MSPEAKKFLEINKNKKVVFTNGCFDIIHAGHVEYLNEAKSLGDVLFIGLNSDLSVKRLKGEERPINSESERKFLLENLKAVDFVEVFSEDTPYNLIKEVKPNLLVKGGDWKEEQIIGSDIVKAGGGKVLSLKFKDGFSTTNIIEKIRN